MLVAISAPAQDVFLDRHTLGTASEQCRLQLPALELFGGPFLVGMLMIRLGHPGRHS